MRQKLWLGGTFFSVLLGLTTVWAMRYGSKLRFEIRNFDSKKKFINLFLRLSLRTFLVILFQGFKKYRRTKLHYFKRTLFRLRIQRSKLTGQSSTSIIFTLTWKYHQTMNHVKKSAKFLILICEYFYSLATFVFIIDPWLWIRSFESRFQNYFRGNFNSL